MSRHVGTARPVDGTREAGICLPVDLRDALLRFVLEGAAIPSSQALSQAQRKLIEQWSGCNVAMAGCFHFIEAVERQKGTVTWADFLTHLRLPCSCTSCDQVANACMVVLRLCTLEARFHESLERLKSQAIYNLAYGLSHELNNPLANIATRAGVLLQRSRSESDQQLLQTIVDSAMRGCEMLGDLMLVARPPKLELQEIELDELARTLFEKSQSWVESQGLNFIPESNAVGTAHLDRRLVCEVVWALVRNAIEASPPSGTICMELRKSEEFLQLRLLDQGSGLSQEALQSAFDPYFSGREAGRGLGLGLSKARRLAEWHGGELEVQNVAGGGCVSTLRLPIRPAGSS